MDLDYFGIVETTCSTQEEADKIIKELFEKKLCVCIHKSQSNSTYLWEDKTVSEDEFVLRIKTKKNLYSRVERVVLDNHSYDLPEIVMVPIIKSTQEYFDWMNVNMK